MTSRIKGLAFQSGSQVFLSSRHVAAISSNMYDSGMSSRKTHCGEGQVEGKRVSEGQRVRKRDEEPGGKKVPSPPGQGVLYILS